MPARAIKSPAALTALIAPMRPAMTGASGAKMPRHSTGIVTSRPVNACDMSSERWISGTSGPMPTTCGRRVSEVSSKPTTSGIRSPILLTACAAAA